MTSNVCEFCGNDFPLSQEHCPHCARPSLFPNVRAAKLPDEKAALDKRYNAAIEQSKLNGSETVLQDYESTVLSDSKAVINRSLNELERLANSNNELYATYYQLIQSRIKIPSGSKWDILRAVADAAFFSGYKENIRFASLSLDDHGLSNYGECSFVLKDSMIAHRASVLEENSVIFMETHKILAFQADKLPRGYRAAWDERGKLCATKAANDITVDTLSKHFPGILLNQGETSADDKFVEVHVFGSMSACTFELIIIKKPARRAGRASLGALKEKLVNNGIKVKVV